MMRSKASLQPLLPILTGATVAVGAILVYMGAHWPLPAADMVLLGLAGGITAVTGIIAAGRLRRATLQVAAVSTERDRFHATLESATDGLWETDAHDHFTYVSAALLDRLGLSDRQPDYSRDWDLWTPARGDDHTVRRRIRAIMARREPFRDIRMGLHLASGEIRYVQLSGRPRFSKAGAFVGYIGTAADVTEQSLSAERAQLAESRLGAALNGMAEGFALFDLHDRLELHNWRFDVLLNRAGAKTVEGIALKTVLLDLAADPAPVEAFFADRFARMAEPLRLQTKEERWLQVRIAPTRDNGTQTLWTDITRTVQQEEEEGQRRLERHHHQKMEAIGTLAGGIAHEINTPVQYIGDNLTFLQGAFTDLWRYIEAQAPTEGDDTRRQLWQELDLDFLKDEVPLALDQSKDGARHVATLVHSMKEFAHPSARDPIAVDMAHALDTTLTVSRNEWKHVAEVTVEAEDDLHPALAVPGEINQVLLNLIVNAVHAVQDAGRDTGQIRVTVRNAGTEAAPMVEVALRDNGTGMAPDVVDRIFEPFFTTKGVGRGSGQGLAIAHDIVVRKHGGTLTVQSTPGEGTCFVLGLPAAVGLSASGLPPLAEETAQ